MNSPTPAIPLPPENLADPGVIIVHGAHAERINVEVVHASPEHRRLLGPIIRFLRSNPKPPAGERMRIIIRDPVLLNILLHRPRGRWLLAHFENAVGLKILLPVDRSGASGPATDWFARLQVRFRERLTRAAAR
ncbi:MAG: hypothetical protein ABSD47_04955 [Candidatus Methylomirabilota bacterium]|jgi:hypothetical protein